MRVRWVACVFSGVVAAWAPGQVADRLERFGVVEVAGAREAGRSAMSLPRADSATLMEAGRRAAEVGDLAQADSIYRLAWQDSRARREAGAALVALHARQDFRLAADDGAVQRAATALGPTFLRYETTHFVILSDADASWTRQRGALLERTRHQFMRAASRLGLDPIPHRHKLLCVLFDDHRAFRAFARAQDGLSAAWVAGYYATRENRVVFFNDRTSPAFEGAMERLAGYEARVLEARSRAEDAARRRDEAAAKALASSADDLERQIAAERARLGDTAAGFASAKAIHEAIHLLAFNTGVQQRDRDYPFWVSEGLAMSFETTAPSAAFGPGLPGSGAADERRRRLGELAAAERLVPLAELVALAEVPGWQERSAEAMYVQSGVLFEHLHRTARGSLARYLRALGDEPAGPIQPERQLRLFVDHFGDPPAIERAMLTAAR